MKMEQFIYIIPIRNEKNSNDDYKIKVQFYDTPKEMYDILYKVKNKTELRIQYPLGFFSNGDLFSNKQTIGTILFQKEIFTNEIIIHESFHCMVAIYRKINADDFIFNEERIVTGCARLAGFLIEQFKDRITK
jgi:hypothetical protein